MTRPALIRFEAVVYRALGGIRPLWAEPNITIGRFHHTAPQLAEAPAHCRPTQYLCLHPMGPLAEMLRHQGARTAAAAEAIIRNVFALRVAVDGVLPVSLDRARDCGIEPADLVGDDLEPCRRWVDSLLEALEPPAGILVPSVALPGTENLVLFGTRHEYEYLRPPRRSRDLPCAPVGMRAQAPATLAPAVHHIDAGEHPALAAWRQGGTFRLVQPRTA